MRKIIFSMGVLALLVPGVAQAAQPFVPVGPTGFIQFGPTTPYSTIDCANFAKAPDGTWHALDRVLFSLGFIQAIVPPKTPIKSGGWIFDNIDLYSQLELQCGGGAVVKARY